ncbi:MAG: hypothetical protein AB7I18_13545 [Candidatus Berkiella sp.]
MGKRKFVAFDYDDTLLLLEGTNKDKVKNPHRLLPVMLFMGHSSNHEMAILTNRGDREEGFGKGAEKEYSTLDGQRDLQAMGIIIDDPYVIRQPREYRNWVTEATHEVELDLYLKDDSEYPTLKKNKQDLKAQIEALTNQIKTLEANKKDSSQEMQKLATLKGQLQTVFTDIENKYQAKRKSMSQDDQKAIDRELEKKFGGKVHRLEQLRQRVAIRDGVETPITDTIMVDDSKGVIEGTKMAGYDTVKATERNLDDNNSDYVKELGQKIGLDEYLDDLVKNPAAHRNDPPMQVAGALMYGIQTRDDFKPKLSDYLKNMTYS